MSHLLRPIAASLLLATSAMSAACIGDIGSPDANDEGGTGSGPGGGDGIADPGSALMRRLTNREYAASIHDLLGVDAAAMVATFPADVRTSGFDNAALTQTISSAHAERYMTAAKAFTAEVLASPALRDHVVGCDVAADRAACLDAFLTDFGRRAWRRPLADDERTRLLALIAAEPDGDAALAVLLEALLQAPHFLFRVEIGAPSEERPDLLRVTGFEMASRLSFFLWGTTPDDTLLDAAGAGELDTAEGVAQMAQEMIADERVQAAMGSFTKQWFRLDALETAKRDPALFPEFGPELLEAMTAEARLLLDEAMWGEGASFLDVYTSRAGFSNAALAAIYGEGAGDELVSVDWGQSADRGGLLTTAAFLTASTRGNATSPIQRGKYVREVVLCDTLPSPPADIPELQQQPGQSAADAEAQHTKDPACAGCHRKLDPLGNGLERYDSIGRLRSEYSNGEPVKLEGMIDGIDPGAFAGGVELGALVRESGWGGRCVLEQVLRWGLGRTDEDADGATLDALDASFAGSQESFRALLVDFARSDAFRYRRPID